jgi:hypothetical protein
MGDSPWVSRGYCVARLQKEMPFGPANFKRLRIGRANSTDLTIRQVDGR